MSFFEDLLREIANFLPFDVNIGQPAPPTGYFELTNRPNYGGYVTHHDHSHQYIRSLGVPPSMIWNMVRVPVPYIPPPFSPSQPTRIFQLTPQPHIQPPHPSQPTSPPSSQPVTPFPSLQPPQPPPPLRPPQPTPSLQPPQPSPPLRPPQPTPSLQPPQSSPPLQPPQLTPSLQPPQPTPSMQPSQPSQPEPSLPSEPSTVQRLEIQYVDVCFAENGKNHHTAKFDLMKRKEHPQLVVRRGQEFHLKLHVDRQFDPEQDGMALVFLLAGLSGKEVPSVGKGTEVIVPLTLDPDAKPDGTSWSAQVLDNMETTLTLKVIASASCIVGEWKLEIDTKLQNGTEAVSFLFFDSIYILFNPWCPHDQVYLEGEDKLHEYIEEDITVIFRGVLNNKVATPWYLGQYEEHILDLSIVLYCIIHPVKTVFRNNAIYITRHLTSALNSSEDDGVMEGCWTGEYEGGVKPTYWVGSMKILQTFYETKKTVKYGQCWVFCGLLTTVCRALGIPARPVTGYNIAHDADGNMLLETYYDAKGKKLEGVDSTWNYHVWTEVWMKRPDLAPGDYNGWNAVDATPLEISDGLYHCGPASVKAIKRGEVMKPFDGTFIYAEVNADVVHWRYLGENKPQKLISSNTSWVGKDLSTKAIGSIERVDLTHDYKDPEGSKEERSIMEKALKLCNNMISRFYLNQIFTLIKFDSILPTPPMIGDSCIVKLSMRSKKKAKEEIKVHVRIEFIAEEYSGGEMELVKEMNEDFTVKSGSVTTAVLEVKYDDYKDHFREQGQFIVCFIADVAGTDFEYIYNENIQIKIPVINIEVETILRAGEICTATASFTNPLSTELTDGIFIFEGSGITPGTALKLDQNVVGKGIAQTKLTWTLPEDGKGSVSAVFNCNQMKDLRGHLEFPIQPAVATRQHH